MNSAEPHSLSLGSAPMPELHGRRLPTEALTQASGTCSQASSPSMNTDLNVRRATDKPCTEHILEAVLLREASLMAESL